MKKLLHAAFVAGALAAAAHDASAAIVITEVDPYGSSASYGADWFELTNTGTSAVSLAGYTMIDNHADSSTSNPYKSGATISIANDTKGAPAALTLANGVTTLGAGQSAVFLEAPDSAAGSSALLAAFESAWFGSKTPTGLLVGTYNDTTSSNYGLSQSGDSVNIFNGGTSSAALVASVTFGADAGTPVETFDNAAGLNDAIITKLSTSGVDGAFVSATGEEVGSPGSSSAVPLPDSGVLMLSGLVALGLFTIGRKRLPASVG